MVTSEVGLSGTELREDELDNFESRANDFSGFTSDVELDDNEANVNEFFSMTDSEMDTYNNKLYGEEDYEEKDQDTNSQEQNVEEIEETVLTEQSEEECESATIETEVGVVVRDECESVVSETEVVDEEVVVEEVAPVENIETPVNNETNSPNMPEEIAPDWVIPLSDVNNHSLVEFGNVEYNWRRVKDPVGVNTNKFEVFCRHVADENAEWNILNGLLSDRYRAADLTTFVSYLNTALTFVGDAAVNADLFKTAWFRDFASTFSIFEGDTNREVFEIISGIPMVDILSFDTMLSLMVLNSYDGKASLTLNFNLKTKINGTNPRVFRDYFSLGRYYQLVPHNLNISRVQTDITDIINGVMLETERLKSKEVSNEFAEVVAKCFKKDSSKMIKSIWENLGPDYKNAFWIITIASYVLDLDFNFGTYYILKNKFKSLVSV